MSDERLPEEGEELTDDFDFDEDGEIGAAEETDSPEEIEADRQQEDENARLRAENDRLKAAMQPQITPAHRAQAQLAELERVQPLYDDQRQQYFNYFHAIAQQNDLIRADQADRAQFKKLMAEQRYPARYEQMVEGLLQQARQQNMNPTRELCLNTIIGAEVRRRRDGGAKAPAAGGRMGRDRSGRGEFTAEDERILKSATWGEVNR